MIKIKDIGEFNLIKKITKKTRDKNVVVEIGDDAAVIKPYKGLQIITTDCLVEDDHFQQEWFKPNQIGMKAIEINISDIAAMGGKPMYVLVSLGLPIDIDLEFVEKLYQGMWKTCDKYNIDIIGGNMTHSTKIFISITLLGEIEDKKICLRSGAKSRDFIFLSGYLGNGRAGLRLFQEKKDGFKTVKDNYLEPKAKLDFALKIAPFVNSMIDISDGLASDLKHICNQSNCGAIIYKDKIPIKEEVRQVAKNLGEDAYDYALFGGEDFELLYTASSNNISKIKGFLIGEIIKDQKILLSFNGKKEIIKESGYNHFSNNL